MKNFSSRLKRVVLYTTALSVLALGTSACNEFNTNGRKKQKSDSEGKSFKISGIFSQNILDLIVSPAYAAGYDSSTCKIATVSNKDKVQEAAVAMSNTYKFSSVVDAIGKLDEAMYQGALNDAFGKDAKFAADYTASFCSSTASPDPANCAFATVATAGKVQDAAIMTILAYKHDIIADAIKKGDSKTYVGEVANAFKADPKFAADYGATYCVAGASAPDPANCLFDNVIKTDAAWNDSIKLSSGYGYFDVADVIKTKKDSAKYAVLIAGYFGKDAKFAADFGAKYCIPKVLPVAYCEMPVSPSSVMSAAIITNKYGYDALMKSVYALDKKTFKTDYEAYVRKDAKFEADFKSSCEKVTVSEASPNKQTVEACIANASTGICAALSADSVLVSVVPVATDKSYSFDFGSQDPSELYAGQVLSVAIFDKSVIVTPGSEVYGQSSYSPIRQAVIGKAKSDFIPNSGVTVVPVNSKTTAVASIVEASYSQPSAMKSAVSNISASDLVAMLEQISGAKLNYATLEAANVDVMDSNAVLKWMLDNDSAYVSAMDTIKTKSEADFAGFLASFDTIRASLGDTTSVFGSTTVAQTNMAADLLSNVNNAGSIADMVKAFWAIDSLYSSAKGDFAASLEVSAGDAQALIMDRLNKVVAGKNADEIAAAFTAIDNYYNNGTWALPNLAPFDDIWTIAYDANKAL